MHPPRFWFQAATHPAARLLAPLGAAYGALTAARMDRPGLALVRPVICIGNFTLGGAGKTPTALALAGLLAGRGHRVAFLSRGYGGRLAGPVRVIPDRHGFADVGDEPLLLAGAAPTVVSRDRPAGARLCLAEGAGIVLMDDGLQNPSLAKDLALAVVDAGVGLGNGRVFPAGPLRAPLVRQWPHVDGVVLIGDGAAGDNVAGDARARGLPVHRARLVADAGFEGQRLFAFAGIGRPQKFFESLSGTGAVIAGTRAFPDHHRYRPTEIAALIRAAEACGATLVTTRKDHVRLPPPFADRVRTLSVTLAFADPACVAAQIETIFVGRT